MSIGKGVNVKINVCQLEYYEGGDSIWIHGPKGTTILRIRAGMDGKITSVICDSNPSAHADVIADGNIQFCLHRDDVP